MNNYHVDSGKFFRYVSRGIQKEMDGFLVIQLTLNFALGIERLLKGILFDVNPTFILVEPGFKHSMQSLYSSKIIEDSKNSGELSANPNADVITFRNSLLRVQHISKVCYDQKNLLFSISNARDIIVHSELVNLDVNKQREILQRDFYPFLKLISSEISIKRGHYFDGSHIKLSKISGALQTDLVQKINLLLETHFDIWNERKGIAGHIEDKKNVTKEILATLNKEAIECPSCRNEAVIYLKPIEEYNPFEKRSIIIGYEVKKLKCQYCKLDISDSSILDHLGIRDKKVERNQKCARCNKELEQDNASGLCPSCDEHYGMES
jgi:hypothetical protein